ncbi:MAG: 1-(5-phosphoribosyl)-5-[(5-phosphoribosylamino)methylideneamino] imidazole-4-carboxamide isomerase [Gemmatimonadales bacterium]|nr:1-(5-phosphoribosyl)-5-[(5-phosphoribosylamino)methylideneamino] imidazole-4-carboxamide isomerase [Gemmatimonadales bacterium]
MIVLPAVDLRDGACVQLVGGRYEDERVRLPDPVAVAGRWRSAGFSELHVVDLDAATGKGDNGAVVHAVMAGFRAAASATSRVQVGGGMGRLERLEGMLAAGADRIVVGTKALEDPAWLERTAAQWPGRIVVAADVRDREVVTRGWAGSSGRAVTDVVRELAAVPLAGILVTAVHREGRLEGPDLDLMKTLATMTAHPLQASGGIRDLDDLRALADAGADRAVVGMAIYTGRLDPEAAAREFGR